MNSIDEAIEIVREKNLRALQDKLTEAARTDLDNTRAEIRSLAPVDSPEYVILDAIASNLRIGREDGFPARIIPTEITNQYVRMIHALGYVGMVPNDQRVGFLTLLNGMDSYYPAGLTLDRITQKEHNEHYHAWNTLCEFIKRNS